MLYPTLQEVSTYREMTTAFGGYNHQLSCQDGQFFDMKNITSQYFPILSPRQKRGIVKKFANPQGILDKEDLMWIDDGKLYINGEEKPLAGVTLSGETKTLAKMGAYVIIMPDKIWYNTEDDKCGYMESLYEYDSYESDKGVEITICEANGKSVSYHNADYYETNTPKDGDYMMSSKNGKPSLKVYSASTKVWLTVASTYVQITAKGIGAGFEKGDGVKITIYDDIPSLQYIFVNEEDGYRSTNTTIIDKTDDTITIPGIIATNDDGSVTTNYPIEIDVERKVPDMAFITECNNRLWGCSKDGHEVYCCKLGDVKNWNCFAGISTDSWAATIGSDGKFTGAITYLGYPMFFKEDSFIKIAVSSNGGHQLKETKCRGVQNGSHRSLSILNETLYYKSTTCVCGYNGSLPVSVSDELGGVRYYDAVSGTIDDRYYISMKDDKGTYHLFVYDTKNGIWCKEDDAKVLYFCKHKDDLYYIDINDNTMKSIGGTILYEVEEKAIEDDFRWFVESGTIGYSSPDNKYVSRINMRITLEFGANVDFYLQYDSNEIWEHKFNMSGKGTKTFTVPIIPKRCDHFKYKITGKGECKIHSIAKTLEEGSDI